MTQGLGYWWPFARTAWGWTIATIGGLAALYYGSRKMLETFDWYMDRFVDYKVQNFLESHVIKAAYIAPQGVRPQSPTPKSIAEIAAATGLTEGRVRGCLNRLKRKKAVMLDRPDYWKADIPPHGPA
jgi:hypothetical protein